LIKFKLENWNNAFASPRAAEVYYPVYRNSKVNGVYPSMGFTPVVGRNGRNKPERIIKIIIIRIARGGQSDLLCLGIK
jgi:predicted enzyme involved in methoxymalonyl-ACP biosynthesis